MDPLSLCALPIWQDQLCGQLCLYKHYDACLHTSLPPPSFPPICPSLPPSHPSLPPSLQVLSHKCVCFLWQEVFHLMHMVKEGPTRKLVSMAHLVAVPQPPLNHQATSGFSYVTSSECIILYIADCRILDSIKSPEPHPHLGMGKEPHPHLGMGPTPTLEWEKSLIPTLEWGKSPTPTLEWEKSPTPTLEWEKSLIPTLLSLRTLSSPDNEVNVLNSLGMFCSCIYSKVTAPINSSSSILPQSLNIIGENKSCVFVLRELAARVVAKLYAY